MPLNQRAYTPSTALDRIRVLIETSDAKAPVHIDGLRRTIAEIPLGSRGPRPMRDAIVWMARVIGADQQEWEVALEDVANGKLVLLRGGSDD